MVYIVVTGIAQPDKLIRYVEIFSTLEDAQDFKRQQDNIAYISFCDLYEARKIV